MDRLLQNIKPAAGENHMIAAEHQRVRRRFSNAGSGSCDQGNFSHCANS